MSDSRASGSAPAPVSPTGYTPKQRQRIVGACCLGWGLEYFDFMLPTLLAPTISSAYGVSSQLFGLALTIQLIGSAIGGLTFGWLGDRFGRRRTLIWSILLYSITTGLVVFAPTFAVFVVLRFFAGVGTGGEWGVGFAWINEAWTARRRGLAGSIVQASLWPAYALAVLVVQVTPDWRLAFLIGVAPALTTVWIRVSCPESLQWQELQQRKHRGKLTTDVAAKATKSQWRQLLMRDSLPIVLLGIVLAFGAQWVPYTATTWMPSLLETDLGMSSSAASLVLYGSSGAAFVGFILAGYLSDLYGRRRVLVTFACGQTVVFAVMFAIALIGNDLGALVWLYVLSTFLTGYFGIFGVWFGELFPTRIRALGSATAYNVGRGLSGFGTLVGGILAVNQGYGLAVGIAVVGAAIVLLGGSVLQDSERGRTIGVEE